MAFRITRWAASKVTDLAESCGLGDDVIGVRADAWPKVVPGASGPPAVPELDRVEAAGIERCEFPHSGAESGTGCIPNAIQLGINSARSTDHLPAFPKYAWSTATSNA
jgi:hypothetical protein